MNNATNSKAIETLKVYFADQARVATVSATAEVREYVRLLRKDEGVYMATIRADFLALRPFEVPRP